MSQIDDFSDPEDPPAETWTDSCDDCPPLLDDVPPESINSTNETNWARPAAPICENHEQAGGDVHTQVGQARITNASACACAVAGANASAKTRGKGSGYYCRIPKGQGPESKSRSPDPDDNYPWKDKSACFHFMKQHGYTAKDVMLFRVQKLGDLLEEAFVQEGIAGTK
jgi:hypothetical protein